MPVPYDGMSIDPRFKKGLELFNHGEYFECHEVIEELWLETPAEDPWRDLYKGVIQAAAAIYQYDRAVLSGARGLYRSAVEYLSKYEPKALGLDVSGLVRQMRECFNGCATWKDGQVCKRVVNPKLVFE